MKAAIWTAYGPPEVLEVRDDRPALGVELLASEPELDCGRRPATEEGRAGIALPRATGIPDRVISQGCREGWRQLIRVGPRLLQAEQIGLGLVEPFEEALLVDGAGAVHVPADDPCRAQLGLLGDPPSYRARGRCSQPRDTQSGGASSRAPAPVLLAVGMQVDRSYCTRGESNWN